MKPDPGPARAALAALEACLTSLDQLILQALASSGDAADLELERANARTQRDLMAMILNHLKPANVTVTLDPALAAQLEEEGRKLASVVQSNALVGAGLETVLDVLGAVRRMRDLYHAGGVRV